MMWMGSHIIFMFHLCQGSDILFSILLPVSFGEYMLLEGQTRIPSGCAISGVISKSRKRMSGEAIIKSISVMHDRSNGLGGGFAAYGIYPEYKNYYALHMFYDSIHAKENARNFWKGILILSTFQRYQPEKLRKLPMNR